jgi:integrase
MHAQRNAPVSGHVWLYKGKHRSTWYAKYRLPDGRQEQKRLGPVWTGNGRPPAGYFTERTAKAALDAILTDARRGTLPGLVRTGATFRDASAEWLRYVEHDRRVKPSTLASYRSAVHAHLDPAFDETPIEQLITRQIEEWRAKLVKEGKPSARSLERLVTNLHGIFERARKVWHLTTNPGDDVERLPKRYSGELDFYSPEEVLALVRAAETEQDGTIYLTAAFTGLRRGELVALRWRDVDFPGEAIRVRASYTAGQETTPKSGKVRAVPMVPQVAEALAKLGQRDHFTAEGDLVFTISGEYLDGSDLRRRYVGAVAAAKLRPIRFHDLRHTFGSLAIDRASIVQVQEWLGHADIDTTRSYLHYKRRTGEAQQLAAAFTVEQPVKV